MVVAAPHPGAETFAANGPGFSVAVCYEISECNAAWIMEHLFTKDHLVEHLGRDLDGLFRASASLRRRIVVWFRWPPSRLIVQPRLLPQPERHWNGINV